MISPMIEAQLKGGALSRIRAELYGRHCSSCGCISIRRT
jgi:hypothetical protein